VSVPFEFDLALRWSDQDLLGHVNNAKIVTLAEEGRVRFQRHLDAARSGDGGSTVAHRVVVRQEIDYPAPTLYEPTLTMRVGVLRIGTKSFTVRQQGSQEGRPVFTVDSIIVNVDGAGASRSLTPVERGELADWMWPDSDGE
jgi:acyl-CoA thioester hydrolase